MPTHTPMGNVGYKKIIIISVVSTTFAIFLDKLGWINAIAKLIPGDW